MQDEAELALWEQRLSGRVVAYREPDLGYQLTALAYWGRRVAGFDELRLL